MQKQFVQIVYSHRRSIGFNLHNRVLVSSRHENITFLHLIGNFNDARNHLKLPFSRSPLSNQTVDAPGQVVKNIAAVRSGYCRLTCQSSVCSAFPGFHRGSFHRPIIILYNTIYSAWRFDGNPAGIAPAAVSGLYRNYRCSDMQSRHTAVLCHSSHRRIAAAPDHRPVCRVSRF